MAASLASAAPVPATGQDSPSKEYKIKAACLINFLKFVEWPEEGKTEAPEPIVIGILGQNPFGSFLDDLAKDQKVRGRAIHLKKLDPSDVVTGCHVLFFASVEKDRMGEILKTLEGRSILTIGEHRGFAQEGGIVNFFIEENKVRFEINPDQAKKSRLKISSKLLSLAKIVP
jgi:hypothetical protein